MPAPLIPAQMVEVSNRRLAIELRSSDDGTDILTLKRSVWTHDKSDDDIFEGSTLECFMEAMQAILPLYLERKAQWQAIKEHNIERIRSGEDGSKRETGG